MWTSPRSGVRSKRSMAKASSSPAPHTVSGVSGSSSRESAGEQADPRYVDAAAARQLHGGVLDDGQTGQVPVGELDDPVTPLSSRRQDQPVPRRDHRQLQLDAGQRELSPSIPLPIALGNWWRARWRTTSGGDDVGRQGQHRDRPWQVTANLGEQLHLALVGHSPLTSHPSPLHSLGEQVREPRGNRSAEE